MGLRFAPAMIPAIIVRRVEWRGWTSATRRDPALLSDQPISPLRTAMLAQVFGGLIAVGLIALVYPKLFAWPLAVACIQGSFAAFSSHKLDAPPWWLPIHVVFIPLVVLASDLGLHPGWYLAAFLTLLLIFWRTDQSRVPLYLSNGQTAAAVAALLPPTPCQVIDLGCGNGTLLNMLAHQRPDCQFVGIEHAPLPWLWAKVATLRRANCRVRYGDFWQQHLGKFDLVYAFLSPAPMPRLWAKAKAEMGATAILVSNSFVVPEVAPDHVVAVPDRRATQLFCYRPGG